METLLRTALWRQFGAAIDTFDAALRACPPALWTARLWPDPPGPPPSWLPPAFSEFWFVSYHTIFWLDLYLSGCPEAEFAPPAPFIWVENDPPASPERPYTPQELHAYLVATRRKGQAILAALTDEQARRIVDYPWAEGKRVSYLELLFYTLRHVQEHAAQLHLFLGRQGIQVADWVPGAQENPAVS